MSGRQVRFLIKTVSVIFVTQSCWQLALAAKSSEQRVVATPHVMAPRPNALQPRQVQNAAQRQIGGTAGAGFSLLNVQRSQSANGKIERLVFSIGDRDGKALKGTPGYFNAQNQKNRIVLDFAQMSISRLDEKALKQALKKSPHVKSIKMMRDPVDQTLTLILDLNGPVKMRTLQVKGQKQTARVILDIIKK